MSGGSNQRTLFQTWGANVPQNKDIQPAKAGKKSAVARRATSSNTTSAATHPPRSSPWAVIGQESTHAPEGTDDIIPLDEEDDDDLMVVAVYEAEKSLQLQNASSFQDDTPAALSPTPSCGRIYPAFPGFDSSSAKVWIYPTNYPIREYQLKISEAALFQNTLVCLPTGLGKTFIASVVMYNFYRWYPSGKIVFMAPTKPLVAQQIEACYKVMGIPQAHMAELTGSTAAKQRQDVWRSKRVFFLTPQVMVNDLSRNTCPAMQVKCVVIDEAHKALGNHAYCQVIRLLSSQILQFRVLALSASPGGDTKSVQSVISNLLISHIELRSEESPDIQAHSHQRSVEKIVVPLGETLSAHQACYLQVLEKFMSRLVQNRVMAHKELRTLSKYQLILARDQFRKNPPPHIKVHQLGMLEGDFALCISLYHGYELLMQMGLRSLFFYVQGIMDGSREMSRAKNELQRTPMFMDLYHEMETVFLKPPAGPEELFVYSHPKLEKLEEVVLQHFRGCAESSADTNGSEGASTRVMIFSSFRESVQEIAAMLNRHAPLIRVMTFMGQASAGKGVKGFTQKEQLEVVQRFRQGGFNTLVSTCVGEEGLDIGEVDLIVCFDAQKNPIRLVQRMGRTGRKRRGRIVVILAEGREERTYNQSQSNKRSVYKSITSNKNGFHMYPNSPRMLPEGVNPRLHKMHITCGQFDHRESSRRSARGRRSNSEGRASLIHPQNLFQQGNQSSDGFLSSSEYSLWASTMKLEDHEAHPTLKPSHFLSIPSDPEPQEDTSLDRPPSRELSLWEWRHWQHKALPFHAVDHSLRCYHFVKVMELIDGMREENEGECHYEQALLPYLHPEDSNKSELKKQKPKKICSKTANRKPTPSHSSWSKLEYIDEEMESEGTSTACLFSKTKQRPLVPQEVPCDDATDDPKHEDHPSNSDDNDCSIISVTKAEPTPGDPLIQDKSPLIDEHDEDVELEAMFYLPTWNSKPVSHSNKPREDTTLRAVLSNVAELLSRSPPPLTDIFKAEDATPHVPPPPRPPDQPFSIRFSLDVDDDDEMDGGCESNKPAVCREGDNDERPFSAAANSPTWEELFEDNDADDVRDVDSDFKEETFVLKAAGKIKEVKSEVVTIKEREESMTDATDEDKKDDGGVFSHQMDDSLDLFEDDEAFLQMTIPEIPTPEDDVKLRTPLSPKAVLNSTENTKNQTNASSTTQSPERTGHRTSDVTDNPQNVNSSSTDCSHLFSVNFDLGYFLEDSEDETEADVLPPSSSPTKRSIFLPPLSKSSTPCNNFARLFSESKVSSPQIPQHRTSRGGELSSPITSPGVRRTLVSSLARPTSCGVESVSRQESVRIHSPPHLDECYSDSEEEVVLRKRRPQIKINPLSSPELSKSTSDVDSPVVVKRKRVFALNVTDETQGEAVSDDDFQNESTLPRRTTAPGAKRKQIQQVRDENKRQKARQFLDEEAELSEEEGGANVSSDEEDDEDQNRFLDGFVVDNTHLSQGLNDSEMQGVYLKSVRSPAAQGKFKMSYRNHHNMDIFSQVPEQDETYAEDSFVVGSDEEELESNEEEVEDVELMPEDSCVDGRRQYATRRRVFLHRTRADSKTRSEPPPEQRAGVKTKRTRVIRINDSSEEEEEGRKMMDLSTAGSVVHLQQNQTQAASSSSSSSRASSLSKVPIRSSSEEQKMFQKLESQHLLSDELDFEESVSKKEPQKSSAQSQSAEKGSPSTSGSVCILVDSRCISSGVELMSLLRQRHAATVHICSLDGSYFIVSNRMAVERHSQSDVAAMQNRKRLVERVTGLQVLFDRVCLIVEKDRTKTGETSRPFQRTRYYDNMVAALVSAGVRLLWSDGAEDTAVLLMDLARLEHRKGQGITVPLEVKGQHRQQVLQMYLSIPSVNYAHALNLSHNFHSIAQLIDSPVEAIQKGGNMSRSRAEEIYRFLRYSCDSFLVNTPKTGNNT
nr:Fanconi anemia group M protein isoform X1 [Nothobranchius furzeri]